MNLQERIKRLKDNGIGYKVFSKNLEVTEARIKHFVYGNTVSVPGSEEKLRKLLEQLENILNLN